MLGFDFKALQALFSSAPTLRVFDDTARRLARQQEEHYAANPTIDAPRAGWVPPNHEADPHELFISLDGRRDRWGETSVHSWKRLATVLEALPENEGYKVVTFMPTATGLTAVWRHTNSEK